MQTPSLGVPSWTDSKWSEGPDGWFPSPICTPIGSQQDDGVVSNAINGLMPSNDFEQIVAQHYEPLYRFAFSLTRAEADACDLTQQTFYLWATKGHQLRDPSKVKSWLFTILHREFLRVRK